MQNERLKFILFPSYIPRAPRILEQNTECFTTCGHYCRRWFPRSLW